MISVVVCTYNRCQTLDRMLASYFAQTGLAQAKQELIVVDNNSSDDTKKTALAYAKWPGFRYVHEAEQGLSAARNRGVAEARGQVIAFLDDDVLVSCGWLRGLMRCYRDTQATVVGGKTALLLEAQVPPWFGPFFRTLLSEVDFGATRTEVPDGIGLWGVNLSFDAAALRRVGGFDPKLGRRGTQLLGGEEMAVVHRLLQERQTKVIYEPQAAVQHIIGPERLTWDYFARLARANGATKQAREAERSVYWQVVRVSRLALTVVSLRLHLAAAAMLDPYAQRRVAWDALCAQSYLARRYALLRRQLELSIGVHWGQPG